MISCRPVSDSPDHMPSVRLYEVDLNIVMSMIRDFAGTLDQYAGVVAAIAKDVRDLQVTSTVIPLGDGSAPVAGPPPSVVQSANVIPGHSSGN